MNIGRYEIVFGRATLFQAFPPTRIWDFRLFSVLKEIRPTDIDKRKQFPLGTPMEYRGRRYCYYRVDKDIIVSKEIPGHSEKAGREICKQLGVDLARVLSIDIFVLHGTLIVKTLDGDVNCHLVLEKDKHNELVFRIVKDELIGGEHEH